MNNHIDEHNLREALHVLKGGDQLFEIRVLIKQPRKKTLSGYFRDADTAVEQMQKLSLRGESYFITLNSISEDCYGREQHDCFIDAPENTTNDKDIASYDWMLIDLDPVRATGVSSSDAELYAAVSLARRVYSFLRRQGFSEPVIAMSGNGMHLLYKVALLNNEGNTEMVKRFLQSLALLFDTDQVKVDTSNFNPSRICKLYGTLAQKGAGTSERPHRMSYIKHMPKIISPTPKAFIQAVADMLPKQEAPQRYNGYQPKTFDIVSWMDQHGIRYTERKTGDYTKYILDECPFDSNHKAPDSMITVGHSGAIGFKCLHDSCQGKTWRDVRLMYEPDAYDRDTSDDDRIDRGYQEHKKYNRDQKIEYRQPTEETPDRPLWLNSLYILSMPKEDDSFIPTGIEGIDNRFGGLKKGNLSLVSGLRGGSKSTVLSMIGLSAVNAGFNTIYYSGELPPRNFLKWMTLQAAGKWNVRQVDKLGINYVVPDDIQRKIAEWLGDHMLLYNNDYSNEYQKIYAALEKKIAEQKTDLVLLDNLMTLDIRGLDDNLYQAQKEFVVSLSNLAMRTRAHIMFVAHPRKAIGFLRLDDVSGAADLSNKVDLALIVHRNNADFHRLSKEMFKWPEDHEAYMGTNVIEIAKERDHGTQDVFIPLWYEKETKRLKNSSAEVFKYGWEPDFSSVSDERTPFDEE